MKNRIARMTLGALVAWALMGGASVAAAAGPAPANLPLIRVGHVGHDHHLALYVAALESAKHKVAWGCHLQEQKPKEVYDLMVGDTPIARLQFVQTEGGAGMPATMIRGEIDVGLGGTAAIAKFADQGQPIKIICPLQTDGDQLALRQGSTITNWASFVAATRTGSRPLKIGYKEPMAVAKLIFERALKEEGIAYGYEARPGHGVVLVNFGSEKSPLPLLESGVLDGLVMNQPGTAMAVHKGLAQVVAELRDLPPAGRWAGHPCCCVAATEAALRTHPDAIKTLLKLIILSTGLINDDPARAVDCAVRWTKNPTAVEAQSIPTVNYRTAPNAEWLRGMHAWFKLVQGVEFFKGAYARRPAAEAVRDLCVFTLYEAAERDLRERNLIKAP